MRTRMAAAMLGLILSTFLVMTASDAKFVSATGSVGNSATAASLQAPSGLSASPSGVTCRISLTWSITPTTWASGHKIYRSGSAAGPWELIATVTPRTTGGYNDESASLKFGVTYHYLARAYFGSWLSPGSNTTSASGPVVCGGGAG